MVKRKSRVLDPPIKTEECDNKLNFEMLLHHTHNASENRNKIAKYKKIETWVDITPRFTFAKLEDSKSNGGDSSLTMKKLERKKTITNEKIKKLIGYIVNDEMGIRVAAAKAGMSYMSAHRYYQDYKNDPEHNIPSRQPLSQIHWPIITQKKINDLIHYIVDEKMKITQAAKKAKIGRGSAAKYYAKYLEDQDRKIPKLDIPPDHYTRRCTQEQINDLISFIVDKNMTLGEAADKVNMARNTAKRYYLKYLNHPNHEIPPPGKFDIGGGKSCTDEEVKTLIHCIVNEGMSLLQAAVKANMGKYSASKYYRQYLKDPNHKIPTPEADNINKRRSDKRHTPDQLKRFFTYIIVDKLNISSAARKANMSENSGFKYYKKLLEYPNCEGERVNASYTPEKMKNLVKYVQSDKMSFTAAAKKAGIAYSTAHMYYQQYMNDPHHNIPELHCRKYTPEDVKKLIDCVEHDKMSVKAAANKINMDITCARRYHFRYINDPEHKIPMPGQRKCAKRYNCSQIIADIYRENPSIEPIHESFNIKLESFEEDSKLKLLKNKHSLESSA